MYRLNNLIGLVVITTESQLHPLTVDIAVTDALGRFDMHSGTVPIHIERMSGIITCYNNFCSRIFNGKATLNFWAV